MAEKEALKEHVRERYSRVARRAEIGANQSCCGPTASAECCGASSKGGYAQEIGYSEEEIGDLPDTVVGACAGCGNPTALAGLKEGEVVLDLGSGGVEFRKGDIEDLPVEDESVDIIISNCVINLAPDKDRVFREAYRVLRPGGRLVVSDIVTEGELPEFVKTDPDAWAECIAGALDEKVYLGKMMDAGFGEVNVLSKSRYMGFLFSAEIEAHKP